MLLGSKIEHKFNNLNFQILYVAGNSFLGCRKYSIHALSDWVFPFKPENEEGTLFISYPLQNEVGFLVRDQA